MLASMELSFAFLADSATVPPDGKLYVLGGGFSAMLFPELPARASFAVVAGFRFNARDAGSALAVELRLVDGDGKLVVPPATLQFQSAGPAPDPNQVVSVPTVTFLSPTFAEPGDYVAEFWHADKLMSSVKLSVEERAAPEVGPRPN